MAKYQIYQESRRGDRKENQDRVGYASSGNSLLLLACDGMGGHANGDVASLFVMHYLVEMFRVCAKHELENPPQFLKDSVITANEHLIRLAHDKGFKEVPRTTCVACVIQDGLAWWINVGDSRLLLVRNGKLRAKTKDHSYVQKMVDLGEITEEEALTHPKKSQIYSCLGMQGQPPADLTGPIALRDGDTICLATDGLWGAVDTKTLCNTLSGSRIEVSIPALLDQAEANSKNNSDNLSAIAMRWSSQLRC